MGLPTVEFHNWSNDISDFEERNDEDKRPPSITDPKGMITMISGVMTSRTARVLSRNHSLVVVLTLFISRGSGPGRRDFPTASAVHANGER